MYSHTLPLGDRVFAGAPALRAAADFLAGALFDGAFLDGAFFAGESKSGTRSHPHLECNHSVCLDSQPIEKCYLLTQV